MGRPTPPTRSAAASARQRAWAPSISPTPSPPEWEKVSAHAQGTAVSSEAVAGWTSLPRCSPSEPSAGAESSPSSPCDAAAPRKHRIPKIHYTDLPPRPSKKEASGSYYF